MTPTTTTTPAASRSPVEGPIEVRSLEGTGDAATWSALADADPYATLFHRPLWQRTVSDVFGHQPISLGAFRDGKLSALLPMVQVDSLVAGRLLISIPYATFGGIIGETSAAAHLLSAAEACARQRGARGIEIRGMRVDRPGWSSAARHAVFVRNLPLHPDELDTFLPRKARAAARQARERDGLEARHDERRLSDVYALYCRSMRRLASLNYPRALFERLAAVLGSRLWVTVVERGARLVAGAVSFVHRDTVCPYFLGVDERIRSTGATNLLYRAVMERAIRAGLRRFDFGRTRVDNTGAFAFKRNQGFEPTPLESSWFAPRGGPSPQLDPSSRGFSAARRIWPHLPLFLTQPAGAWLSRSIPG